MFYFEQLLMYSTQIWYENPLYSIEYKIIFFIHNSYNVVLKLKKNQEGEVHL